LCARDVGPDLAVTGLRSELDRVATAVDRVIVAEGIGAVDDQVIQQMMALAVKLYVAKSNDGHDLMPVNGGVTATEVAMTSLGLLRAVNLDVFELSLWQHWGRS
jgi:hypothetical protein